MPTLEAIKYARGNLQLLDQRLLPAKEVYLNVRTCEDAHDLIRKMAVRGAPAIAVAGVLALAVDLHNSGAGQQYSSPEEAASHIQSKMEFLVTSRPTAVNLLDTSRKLSHLLCHAVAAPGTSGQAVTQAVIEFAEQMMHDDVAANRAIGTYGAAAMLEAASTVRCSDRKIRVLTHCNTGSLATVQYGTALGCIRALHDLGKLEHTYCTETRPYNQGARLTAYELVVERIPVTLIADSAAAALMKAGRVDAVVVGADRVAANGDTANKIGTCMLSIAASAYGVPFYVAAPSSSIDLALGSGKDIEIEERGAEELTHSASHKDVRVVVEGVRTWNPAFDVADAASITGIITERGMIPKVGGCFDIWSFFEQHKLLLPKSNKHRSSTKGSTSVLPVLPSFFQLTVENVCDYVASDPMLAARVGPQEGSSTWEAAEIGDGNINFVFTVKGPTGTLLLKQGLPFVRCVGESWPLTQDRIRAEAESLQELYRHCPEHVPKVYKFDPGMHLVAMQYLAPPHVVLRYGLLEGNWYPQVAEHAAEYLSCCLFQTSMHKLDSASHAAVVRKFGNPEMCALTEQVIFTDPFYPAKFNHHTSPQLDAAVVNLQRDAAAKAAAVLAKAIFLTRKEALLHGDLHTGSCMVTADTFYVIDTEFAFCGPMAFDIGKLIANFLLTYFALDGHRDGTNMRSRQQEKLLQVPCVSALLRSLYCLGNMAAWCSAWLPVHAIAMMAGTSHLPLCLHVQNVQVVRDLWTGFVERFETLRKAEGHKSALFASVVLEADEAALVTARELFYKELLHDALRFAGCVMIRRLVGIAHIADFERITDSGSRASCELPALEVGRELLVNCGNYADIDGVARLAAEKRDLSMSARM